MKSYAPDIPDETIQLFIDSALNLKVVQYRPYHIELEKPLPVDDFETELYRWYIEIRSHLQNSADGTKLAELLEVEPNPPQYQEEMKRYFGSKLHVVASLIGGIASQEAVKLLTHQFVPINNTLILNGLTGEAAVY